MKKMVLGVAYLLLGVNAVQAANSLPPLPSKQLQSIKMYQTQIQAALKNATPAQADKLLLQYIQKLPKLIDTATQSDDAFLNTMMAHVKLNQYEQVVGKSAALKAREKQLAKYGLRYKVYPPTGGGFITLAKNHYSQFFGTKVSPAAQAYLRLRDEQAETDLFYDQEMMMPYEQVGERVIAWERYLNQYGHQSPLLNHAKCEYIVHQSAFLTGGYMENRKDGLGIGITGIVANFSEAFDPNPKKRQPEKLKSEVRRAWADYQKKYPQSASSKLIAKMPKKPPFSTPAQRILDDYHKKVGLYALTPERCAKLWF